MLIMYKTRPTICASSRGNTDGSALMVLNGRIGYAAISNRIRVYIWYHQHWGEG